MGCRSGLGRCERGRRWLRHADVVHVDEDIVGDSDVAGDAADEAHAGVERDVAAHASKGAAAHSTWAGHDEQALEVVFPTTVLHHPTRALVIEPLGLRFGKGRGVLVECELEIFERSKFCFAEKDAGFAMNEAQAVAGSGVGERGTQRGICLQSDMMVGDSFHLAQIP